MLRFSLMTSCTLLCVLMFFQQEQENCWKCSWAGKDPVQLCFTHRGIFLYEVTFPAIEENERKKVRRKLTERLHCSKSVKGRPTPRCGGIEGNSTDIPFCSKHFTARFSSTGKHTRSQGYITLPLPR